MKTRVLCLVLLAGFSTYLPAKNYNILDFGAASDTSKLSTQAIQAAIDACNQTGGGQVCIPAGSFKTGSIFLKSHVLLYFERGAILYGSSNLSDYVSIKPAYRSLRTQTATIQLIYAENAEDTGIDGSGIIDGQGAGFKKMAVTDEGITRPHLLRFITCRNVRVEHITLRNSACWMQHYLACDNIRLKGLTVFNQANVNNDALDLDGCRNVTVSDLITDSEDDGITLKSTSPRLCENIVVTNCVISSRCNAIKLGTETNGGFRNIHISNCVVKPSEVVNSKHGKEKGLAGIALEIVDGGIMEGISISGIQIEGTTAPIFIRLGNRARPYQEDVPVTTIGTIKNISLSDIHAIHAGTIGCSITGLPGHPVQHISLHNIDIAYLGGIQSVDLSKTIDEKISSYPESTMWGNLPAYGFYIRHAANLSLDGLRLMTETADQRPALMLEDVNQSTLNNLYIEEIRQKQPSIYLKTCHDLFFANLLNIIKPKQFISTENCSGISILK
ncbi:MAG: glycosyl hydrolase family 28 protein [Bacteroidota bacterium]|nr:glycosyl hydrolase family 28 protein [Bacteroidota bacterium]